MVAVYGACGDDVVLVLIHQGQLGVVIDCRNKGEYIKYKSQTQSFSSKSNNAAIKAAAYAYKNAYAAGCILEEKSKRQNENIREAGMLSK